jgi:hypothetical protein
MYCSSNNAGNIKRKDKTMETDHTVIATPFETYSNTATAYQVRTKTYQGRKHLIVPVVMMINGVHSGSHGPILHTDAEFGKFPASWDGIPVMIGHPKLDGSYVSANVPEVMEQAVGRVFHSHIKDGKLKAEVWLDKQRMIAQSPEALSYIMQNRALDVSIGVFSDDDPIPGEYNGENYIAIARNHRPDHLALLPGEQGACSWADGCGIRANVDGNSIISNNTKKKREMADNNLTSCFLGKVEKIAANANLPFSTDEDKEFLLTQTEQKLDAILVLAEPKIVEVEKVVEKEVPQALSAEDQEALNYGKQALKEKRDSLIEGVKVNAKGVWTDEDLANMSNEHLEKLNKTFGNNVDYSLNGIVKVNTGGIEPMLPLIENPKN